MTVVSYRYWLTDGAESEREVSKEEWVAAERAAGFHNAMGRPEEPGTAAWSAGHISGRLEYVTTKRVS